MAAENKPIIAAVQPSPVDRFGSTDELLLHIQADERENPEKVISQFCNEISPGEMREYVERIKEIVVADSFYNNEDERDKILSFFYLLLRNLEASYLIYDRVMQEFMSPGKDPK
jgi:hypothetical protein